MSSQSLFVCSKCNTTYSKWVGQCDVCKSWNTIAKEEPLTQGPKKLSLGGGRGEILKFSTLSSKEKTPERTLSGVKELDRALGGGLVNASAILVGGDPGIGKSTLLLQGAARFSRLGLDVVYISGEEAVDQIRLRAKRLNLQDSPVKLAAETNLRNILTTLDSVRPNLAIIDSIQTIWSDNVDSAPGSVSQVRVASHELISFAKTRNTSIILVGHVTKDGQLAGPRVVEHMVDTVLYFEGERNHNFRILRAVKNRFGATDEIGVFEMTSRGLIEVSNPSAMFIGDREKLTPGSAIFAGIEGTRTVLSEIQALVSPTPQSQARRTVVGIDSGRLATILAVLESHCNIKFSTHDVYLNVAGGLRITEPAADLAIAAALVSSRIGLPLPVNTIIFGEISLSGSLRSVSQTENRLREAKKLGFESAFIAQGKERYQKIGVELEQIVDLNTFVKKLSLK
ncbi:MAG: DNA repair protein RadA [Paracoccaceae bacterium]